MRELNIACANSRSTKQLTNKKITLSALKERLKVTIRTTESAEEYARLPRSKRDAAKDHGGIVAGVLKGGRRKIDTVVSRSMVTLDGDQSRRNSWRTMNAGFPTPPSSTAPTATRRRRRGCGYWSP